MFAAEFRDKFLRLQSENICSENKNKRGDWFFSVFRFPGGELRAKEQIDDVMNSRERYNRIRIILENTWKGNDVIVAVQTISLQTTGNIM